MAAKQGPLHESKGALLKTGSMATDGFAPPQILKTGGFSGYRLRSTTSATLDGFAVPLVIMFVPDAFDNEAENTGCVVLMFDDGTSATTILTGWAYDNLRSQSENKTDIVPTQPSEGGSSRNTQWLIDHYRIPVTLAQLPLRDRRVFTSGEVRAELLNEPPLVFIRQASGSFVAASV